MVAYGKWSLTTIEPQGVCSLVSLVYSFQVTLYVQFYVVTETSLYILNGVVHTAVKETIPFAK